MNIKDIFNVFSNRTKNHKEIKISLNLETRNKIIMIIDRNLKEGNGNICLGANYSFEDALLQVGEMFQLKLGQFTLNNSSRDELEDILNFIGNCEAENFLDFIEYIFKTKEFDRISGDIENKIINDINYIFQQDNINFKLTSYIEEWNNNTRFPNSSTRNIISYPQIISKDDDFTYSEIIAPALDILKDKRFSNANKEFLESLDHYKNKRYKESITSCCSSIESTIKIIFKIKSIQYNLNSTLSPLIDQLSKKTSLYDWMKNVLISPATIRNKLGSSHGKGDNDIIVNREQARYQINITASEIIFLINELL
ncbi:DUF7014 domain-containing protein [Clostridium tyrobutyricum]|uniref:DUF7014 domain-containing protein n=1 Tax=Clostridium tyrobutyricum TaxID=1519 RepID=UPI001C38195B|nr:abortive infection family protein [Clostridium tyrobutyricum]MBV4426520.1 abortive infection family protein [Clostridium tyrobutyricum]